MQELLFLFLLSSQLLQQFHRVVFDAHLLGQVAGHEAEIEVGVGFELGVAEDALVDLGIVFDQRVLAPRDAVVQDAVVGQLIRDAVGYLAFLQNVQEHRPVLTLADGGHVELAELRCVVDAGEAADLVVVLHVFQRQRGGHFHHARQFRLLIAGVVAAVAQAAVFLLHEGQLTFQLFRCPAVVAVAEGDIAAAGVLDGVVAAVAGSAVLIEEEYLDFFVFCCVALKDGARVVARVVISDNQLPVRIGLAEDAFYAFLNELLRIVCRHDDGYELFFDHVGLSALEFLETEA